jgi:MscS family membrane protein
MVDSILDNLSQRTLRRGDLRLELDLETTSDKVEGALAGLKKILNRKEITDANAFLAEISANAIVIACDYYTAPVTIKEFNEIRQDINLQSLKLMEQLQVQIAGNNFLRLRKDQ